MRCLLQYYARFRASLGGRGSPPREMWRVGDTSSGNPWLSSILYEATAVTLHLLLIIRCHPTNIQTISTDNMLLSMEIDKGKDFFNSRTDQGPERRPRVQSVVKRIARFVLVRSGPSLWEDTRRGEMPGLRTLLNKHDF